MLLPFGLSSYQRHFHSNPRLHRLSTLFWSPHREFPVSTAIAIDLIIIAVATCTIDEADEQLFHSKNIERTQSLRHVLELVYHSTRNASPPYNAASELAEYKKNVR